MNKSIEGDQNSTVIVEIAFLQQKLIKKDKYDDDDNNSNDDADYD